MTTATAIARPFVSLCELQEQHAVLVKKVGTNALAPNNLELIDRFVRRSLATGTVLDAPDDRDAAQSLITFWITRLRSAVRFEQAKPMAPVPKFDDTLLAEFLPDALIANVIRPADEWLNTQLPSDQELVHRLVIRLIRLRDDGEKFDVVSGVRGICDELVPEDRAEDRAERVLQELVRYGIVRTSREVAGQPEYALRSGTLLDHWARLGEWTKKRKQFRKRAEEWAKKREAKAAAPVDQSFGHRVEQALGQFALTVGIRIESGWTAVLRRFRVRASSTEFLTPNEYAEAESYRDKNAAESKLIYLKRQLDKDREERRHVRVALLTTAAAACAVLAVVGFWGWRDAARGWAEAKSAGDKETEAKNQSIVAEGAAREAKEREERERKLANLTVSAFQVNGGNVLSGGDAPGALLWYAAAWSKFTENADPPADGKPDPLRTNHLLRLGALKHRLPTLTAMAFQSDGTDRLPRSVATVAPSGKVALTVGFRPSEKELFLDVNVWRDTDSNRWERERLSFPLPPDRSSPNPPLGAYLSPNGQAAVVAVGRDKEVTLYRLTIPLAGQPTGVVEPPIEGTFTDGKFSPDGRHFGLPTYRFEKSGLKKSTVRVWSVTDWRSLLNSEHEGTIGPLVFAPAGTPARVAGALGSDSPTPKTLCLEWALNESGSKQPDRSDQPKRYGAVVENAQRSAAEEVMFVTYGPADQNLLFVARGGQRENVGAAWLFDTRVETQDQGGEALDRWKHFGPIMAAAFSPSGDRLVTGSRDGGVVHWRVLSRGGPTRVDTRYVVPSGKHNEQVFQVSFSPDGQQVVTASRDQRAMIWDATTGRLVLPLHHSGSVTEVAFTGNGAHVVTASQSAAYRWALPRTDSRSLLTDGFRSAIQSGATAEAFDPNGQVVVLGGWSRIGATALPEGWARAWNVTTGIPLTLELPHDKPVRHIAVVQNPRLICTTTDDGAVRIWDEKGKPHVVTPACDERAVFTTFGRHDGRLHLLVIAREHSDSMTGATVLSVHPIGADGNVEGAVQTVRYDHPLTAGVFNPKCERVAAYSGDAGDGRGRAVVWELGSDTAHPLEQPGAKPEERKPAHQEPITHAAFSRNGDRLVVTSRDDTATVWVKSDTGWAREELRGDLDRKEIIDRHTADINSASFDDTGNRVVTASADGSAVVWERVAEERQGRYRPKARLRPEQAAGGVSQAMFINDRLVLTASIDRAVRLWDSTAVRPLVSTWADLPAAATLRYQKEEEDTGRVIVFGRDEAAARFAAPTYSGPAGGPSYQVSALPFVIMEWPLAALSEPPIKEFDALAQLTAARQISPSDPTQTIPLPLDKAGDLWPTVGPNLTAEPPASKELVSWNIRQAMQCEFSANWHGARWHWDRSLKGDVGGWRHVILARSARACGELRDWAGAETAFKAALELGTDDALLLCARAETRMRAARAEQLNKDTTHWLTPWARTLMWVTQAVADYRLALEKNSNDHIARVGLADAHHFIGNFAAAVEQYNALLKMEAGAPELLRKRGESLRMLGQFERAAKDYLAAGRFLKTQRRWEAADVDFRFALTQCAEDIKTKPSHRLRAEIHFEMALVRVNRALQTYDQQQRQSIYREARKYFLDAIELGETDWEFWREIGRCHEGLREWKEARDAYQKALRLNPMKLTSQDTPFVAGWAGTLVQLKDWDAAVAAYQTLIGLDPKTLQHHLRLAEIHLRPTAPENKVSLEGLDAARACLEAATKVPALSKDSVLLLRLATVQLAAGRIDEYRATCDRMFGNTKQAQGDVGNAQNNTAWAAALAKGMPESAVELAKRAVESSARNANVLNTYGAVLYRAGKGKEGQEQLQKATKDRALASPLPEQLAYGNALDQLFEAMILNGLEQREAARLAFDSALQSVKQFEAAQQFEDPAQNLRRVWARLEFDILSREAQALINP